MASRTVAGPAPESTIVRRSSMSVLNFLTAFVARVGETVYFLGDELRLVVLGVRDIAGDLRARARVGPQVLGAAGLVALDDRVGGAQDRLRGAVVLLQEDRRRVRVVLLELEDVADGIPAEGAARIV